MSSDVAAVLFDLDGTLVDHTGAVVSALQDWLSPSGSSSPDRISSLDQILAGR